MAAIMNQFEKWAIYVSAIQHFLHAAQGLTVEVDRVSELCSLIVDNDGVTIEALTARLAQRDDSSVLAAHAALVLLA